ncbi:MAG: chemotaxis-specific protein-glutamate methyltransferase CheB, partial [candidate division Zixibacteria bacterium]|nr:chemotaxis-specific protein-glutamate methyltransferase CheB [candidate division Zixibacteria bacterium]
MGTAKVRALVVDDSAFMRKAISCMLETDPEIEVVGAARDGAEGVELAAKLHPDIITMDIEMPGMDGLTALRKIMESNPTPVMMISSLTSEGASATLEAFDLGAVDFIPKEMSFVSMGIVDIQNLLRSKVKDIARRKSVLMQQATWRARRTAQQNGKPPAKRSASAESETSASGTPARTRRMSRIRREIGIIALGASTGGPPALQEVITNLPKNLPVGMIVAQHMPPRFTQSLAERLDSMSEVTVSEAKNGDEVEPGHVYIAPGGKHMIILRNTSRPVLNITKEPSESLYKPSVDIMMGSVLK